MSKQKRRSGGKHKGKWKAKREREPTVEERDNAVVEETAGIFTSLRQIMGDFADQCELTAAELEGNIRFTRLGIEIWTGRSEEAQKLVEGLKALEAVQEKHLAELVELGKRFSGLWETAQEETLDPPEAWEGLVRERLFPVELRQQMGAEGAAQHEGGCPGCAVCGKG